MIFTRVLISGMLTLLIFENSYSQNYQIVNPDYISYYYSNQSYFGSSLNPLRIDSSLNDANSREYFLPKEVNSFFYDECNHSEDKCCSPVIPCWMGTKIIIQEDGTNLIICGEKDTVIILTSALINQEWKLYGFTSGDYIEAKITSIDSITFNGFSDSVKVIEINLFNSNYELIDSYINGYQLILSKSHGLFNALNLRDFPNFPEYNIFNFELVLIDGDQKNRLTTGEVFNFQVNDEFHVKYFYEGQDPPPFREHIYKILDRNFSANQDTVIYQVEHRGWGYSDMQFYYEKDTIIEKHYDLNNNVVFSYLDTIFSFREFIYPNEPIFSVDSSMITSYSLYKISNGWQQVIEIWNTQFIRKDEGINCYLSTYTYDNPQAMSFIEGCGNYQRDYFRTDIGGTICAPCRRLVYFKKSDETWGTPLDEPDHVDLNASTEVFQIYPNPNNGDFKVVTDLSNFIVMITDITGRLCYQQEYSKPGDINISIPMLNPGIYVIRVNSPDRAFSKIFIIH
jgi:hypothetical protein